MNSFTLRFFFGKAAIILASSAVLCVPAWKPVFAGAITPTGNLCTLEAQLASPADCAAEGPAAKRMEYLSTGLLPLRQSVVRTIDAQALGELNRKYASVDKEFALPVYENIDDAIANRPKETLEKGLVFVSYTEIIEQQEGNFLRTGDDKIVRRDDVSLINIIANQFHGVELREQPSHPFGWIIVGQGVKPSRTPGEKADPKTKPLLWYTRVDIYDVQHVDGVDWYMIGFGQWVRQYNVSVVWPKTALPAGVAAGAKWIGVNLFEQTVAAYEGNRLVFATMGATGQKGMWTRPGLYQIYAKLPMQTMTGSLKEDRSDFYYVEDVPWIMYFDGGRGLHGAYWHNVFGYLRSHGCVNMPVADAHWLYNWAEKDTWVYVFDPSGNTPTDPESNSGSGAP